MTDIKEPTITKDTEPLFAPGDPVFIRDETDSILQKYPYTVGRRYRYGGATCKSWLYELHGIRGTRIGSAFEDQLVAR
jgi:hypothetical protein